MKPWSVVTALVFGLSLGSWLIMYRVDGMAPGHGLTVMLVGVWLAIVTVIRLLIRRLKG
jgi:uncharacterized membrane protein